MCFADECLKFLEKQAKSLDLPIKTHIVSPGKPIVIISWIGTKPNLPTILLNSHMDVVTVYEVSTVLLVFKLIPCSFIIIIKEKWTYKPFSAHIDEKGNIYARGTQDMKCVGIQYLEAIRRLKNNGVKLRRTLHVSFVPGMFVA